jgi:hypothetical protein
MFIVPRDEQIHSHCDKIVKDRRIVAGLLDIKLAEARGLGQVGRGRRRLELEAASCVRLHASWHFLLLHHCYYLNTKEDYNQSNN